MANNELEIIDERIITDVLGDSENYTFEDENTDDIEDKEEDCSDTYRDTDCFQEYLKTIGEFEVLSAEEEKELIIKAQNGDNSARNKMIEHNLKLVVSIAKKYKVKNVDIDDLIQEGNMAISKAIDMFDVSLGNKFSTYATWWIKQGITRYIANCSRTIRIPVHAAEKIYKAHAVENKLRQELLREPTEEEIANELDMTLDSYRALINKYIEPVSLDTPVRNSEETEDTVLGDFISCTDESPEEQYSRNEARIEIMKVLYSKDSSGKRRFTDREVDVILRRYGFINGECETLEQIGADYNITRERIRQLESKAIKKLRNQKFVNLRDFLGK